MPEISIILPFYNAESNLERALYSILNQSFDNFECLLVNNNSIDKSVEIVQTFCQRDQRFRLLVEKKQGVTHAHNQGMKFVQGKYIARMDADDWMFPDRLQQQYQFLEEHPTCDAVAGLAEYVPHKPNTDGFKRYVHWSNSLLSQEDIYLNQFVESPIINPTMMWREEISDQFGSYQDGLFPEDYELWLRWLSKGVKITKLPYPVIKWYDADHRLTRIHSNYTDQAFFKIKTKYLTKWLMEHNPFYPRVVVWGASKISRNRAKILEDNGIEISNYIDISKKRKLDKAVLFYQDIPEPGRIFILIYLKEETMRTETVKYLQSRNYMEGQDFLLVS